MSQVRNPVWLKHSSRIFKLQHCCPYLAYLVEYAIAKFITSIKNSYSFGKGQYLWNIMGTVCCETCIKKLIVKILNCTLIRTFLSFISLYSYLMYFQSHSP